MSKDEALEKWLDAENIPHAFHGTRRELAARAWHAAVKHALAFVVGELNENADDHDKYGSRSDSKRLRAVVDDIKQMKP